MRTHFSVFIIINSFCPTARSETAKINGQLIVSSYFNPWAGIPEGSFTAGWLEKDVVNLLSATLNFTFEVRPPRDVLAVGSIVNGTGKGSLGQLLRKEVDFFTSGAEMSIDKAAYMAATYPVLFEAIKIMTNYPKISSKSDALVAIYSNTVWVSILLSTLTVAIALHYLVKLHNPNSESIAVLIFGVIASQGGYFRYRYLPSRLIWGAWCLSLVILVNVYTGTLTSFLSAANYQFAAHSIDDVAKNPRASPYVLLKSPVEETIRKCPLAACQIIKSRWDANKDLTLNPTNDFISLVTKDENNVMIASEAIANPLVTADYRKMRRCRLTLAKNAVYTRQTVLLLQRDSPHLEAISRQIMLFHEHGLMKHWQRKYSPDPAMCYVTEKRTQAKPAVLTVAQMKHSFILLLAGMVASFTSFIFTLVFGRARLHPISV